MYAKVISALCMVNCHSEMKPNNEIFRCVYCSNLGPLDFFAVMTWTRQ